jgi:hypothetical protein
MDWWAAAVEEEKDVIEEIGTNKMITSRDCQVASP